MKLAKNMYICYSSELDLFMVMFIHFYLLLTREYFPEYWWLIRMSIIRTCIRMNFNCSKYYELLTLHRTHRISNGSNYSLEIDRFRDKNVGILYWRIAIFQLTDFWLRFFDAMIFHLKYDILQNIPWPIFEEQLFFAIQYAVSDSNIALSNYPITFQFFCFRNWNTLLSHNP